MKPLPRMDFEAPELDESTLPPTPLHLTIRWFKEAIARHDEYKDLLEPSALYLATTGADMQPSGRIVLMRLLDENGPGWMSRLTSNASADLAENDRVCASLVWFPLFKQIHFQGRAHRVEQAALDSYWSSRPEGARMTTVSQDLSQPVASRAEMEARYAKAAEQTTDRDHMPTPESLAGWQIECQRIEFFSGRDNRLHDRLVFTNPGGLQFGDPGWQVQRVMP